MTARAGTPAQRAYIKHLLEERGFPSVKLEGATADLFPGEDRALPLDLMLRGYSRDGLTSLARRIMLTYPLRPVEPVEKKKKRTKPEPKPLSVDGFESAWFGHVCNAVSPSDEDVRSGKKWGKLLGGWTETRAFGAEMSPKESPTRWLLTRRTYMTVMYGLYSTHRMDLTLEVEQNPTDVLPSFRCEARYRFKGEAAPDRRTDPVTSRFMSPESVRSALAQGITQLITGEALRRRPDTDRFVHILNEMSGVLGLP